MIQIVLQVQMIPLKANLRLTLISLRLFVLSSIGWLATAWFATTWLDDRQIKTILGMVVSGLMLLHCLLGYVAREAAISVELMQNQTALIF